jgi:hypothetical protein
MSIHRHGPSLDSGQGRKLIGMQDICYAQLYREQGGKAETRWRGVVCWQSTARHHPQHTSHHRAPLRPVHARHLALPPKWPTRFRGVDFPASRASCTRALVSFVLYVCDTLSLLRSLFSVHPLTHLHRDRCPAKFLAFDPISSSAKNFRKSGQPNQARQTKNHEVRLGSGVAARMRAGCGRRMRQYRVLLQ